MIAPNQLRQVLAKHSAKLNKSPADAVLQDLITELITLQSSHAHCLLTPILPEVRKYETQVRQCSDALASQLRRLTDCDNKFADMLQREVSNGNPKVRESL